MESRVHQLDKAALGRRIREIRLAVGLRQWELARILGTSQSAVHKYEHGVIPEPRRLVELARVGKTSIEWVLTGKHWENGSNQRQRLTSDVLDTACKLREIGEDQRAGLNEALRITREAVEALRNGDDDSPGPDQIMAGLRDHTEDTLQLLESAWRIQRAVLRRVVADAQRRLGQSEADTRQASREGGDSPTRR